MATKKRPTRAADQDDYEATPQNKFEQILDLCNRHRVFTTIIVVLIVLGIGGMVFNGVSKSKAEADRVAQIQETVRKNLESDASKDSSGSAQGTDAQLISSQESLIESYGKTPNGYIRDWGGGLLSLGDSSMTSDNVLYAYLKGISQLDMASVQKYSRRSAVYNSFEQYFDQNLVNTGTVDSKYEFQKSLYRQAMLSMQVTGIGNQVVFNDNKVVYTVNVKALDYSDKSFVDDAKVQADIYNTLRKYTATESDKEKAQQYLQNWLVNYYSSGKAKLTDKKVDITLQRYPDLNTGWLVSIDNELDNMFRYADGNPVYQYIMDNYQDWYTQTLSQEYENKSASGN